MLPFVQINLILFSSFVLYLFFSSRIFLGGNQNSRQLMWLCFLRSQIVNHPTNFTIELTTKQLNLISHNLTLTFSFITLLLLKFRDMCNKLFKISQIDYLSPVNSLHLSNIRVIFFHKLHFDQHFHGIEIIFYYKVTTV